MFANWTYLACLRKESWRKFTFLTLKTMFLSPPTLKFTRQTRIAGDRGLVGLRIPCKKKRREREKSDCFLLFSKKKSISTKTYRLDTLCSRMFERDFPYTNRQDNSSNPFHDRNYWQFSLLCKEGKETHDSHRLMFDNDQEHNLSMLPLHLYHFQ
jgi:hypothetical protein